MKCMTHCLWYLSLKLGAYLICFVFLITSITICCLLSARIFTGLSVFPATLKIIIDVLAITQGILFVGSCTLLYGLCLEKLWPLLLFIVITLIVAAVETVLVVYIIIQRDSLPNEAIGIAAGQVFIFVIIIFSAAEIFSLFMQWREDMLEDREHESVLDE